ncbi:Protein-glutamate methylesterase/protein-glutamine glutaminase [Neolewinella maritima]|uniref:Protein-glutamate methylesterase/protein-glutamine glutaminase n=1 Tax=Neolewinella maritima TaxID=1383882 RepID=A0ABN8F324_9BACT|nr:response regulator [Neolewinella maritima]CAH1001366.1 Protein-glutamate methylesterase/protein-glutamine glutaminase [Neolewinella maritima]
MSDEIFKVFILEDMPVDLELVKRQVRKYRAAVLFAVARNRSEFESKVVTFQPDIVLSDYNLPDMNGLEALLYVREHLDSTPFIFITGILNDEEKVAEAVLTGASGYLLKENLRNLPELMGQIMTQNKEKTEQREQDWERRRNVQIKLRKSIAQLRQLNFAGSDEIALSLQQVADDLA